MTALEKKLQKLRDRRQDNNWTFAELAQLLESVGFVNRGGKGSHQNFYRKGTLPITLPCHGGKLKAVYVKNARERIH